MKLLLLKKHILIITISLFSLLTVYTVTMCAASNVEEEKKYIKWVDCNLTLTVMEKTSKIDIDSHNNEEAVKINWIELIAYLAHKYGNDFKKFKQKDLDDLIQKLKSGSTMEELTRGYEVLFILL